MTNGIRSNDREQVRYQGVAIVKHALPSGSPYYHFACPACPFSRYYGSEQGALTRAIEHMGDVHRLRVALPATEAGA